MVIKRSNSVNVRVKLSRWASAPTASLKPKYAGRSVTDGEHRNGGVERRESFLYRLPSGDSVDAQQNEPQSPEGQIVTPFAQILASLKEVRSNLEQLSLGRTTVGTQITSEPGGSDKEVHLAEEALQELEWCLDQLEGMEVNKSVADMAANKFKNMLNRELSVLEGSKDGKMISDHIKDVYCTQDYDHDCREGGEGRLLAKVEHQGSSSMVNRIAGDQLVPSRPSSNSTSTSYYGVQTDSVVELEEVMGGLSSTWGLDVFTASSLIRDSRVLTCTTFRILQERDLLRTFQIPGPTLLCFLMTLEDHYLKEVQYHNHLHAADVTQSCHVLLNSAALREVLPPWRCLLLFWPPPCTTSTTLERRTSTW